MFPIRCACVTRSNDLIVFLYFGYSRGIEFYDFRVAGVRDRGYPGGFGAEFFHDVDVDVRGA